MGAGNYYFRDEDEWINTYYSETEDEFDYDNLKYEVSRHIKGLKPSDGPRGRDAIAVAENGILEVRFADNGWSVAIACIPKIDRYGRKNPMYEKSANRVMKEIQKITQLHAPNGAWMSTKIKDKDYKFY